MRVDACTCLVSLNSEDLTAAGRRLHKRNEARGLSGSRIAVVQPPLEQACWRILQSGCWVTAKEQRILMPARLSTRDTLRHSG